MAHKIVIDLSLQSINDAIKWAEQEKKKILDTIHTFMQMLIDEGVTIAKSQVDNIDSGTTLNSIQGMFKGEDKAVIIAGGNACWLEFGTGVDRNPEPYPEQVEGLYPHKPSTSGGWYFPTDNEKYALSNPDGSLRKFNGGDWDGKYVGYTRGIKANKFMLYARIQLESIAPSWAMDLFSNI